MMGRSMLRGGAAGAIITGGVDLTGLELGRRIRCVRFSTDLGLGAFGGAGSAGIEGYLNAEMSQALLNRAASQGAGASAATLARLAPSPVVSAAASAAA